MTTPRRMIVVDDDPKVRLLLERAFRAPEFETYAFPTGRAALDRVVEIRPDCVVSDMLMPDMDGESLLRALRSLPGLEHVPFIALSAVRSEARIRAVVGAGADAFLLKPFPLRELTDKVRSLLDRPGAMRQTRGPLGEDMQPTRPVMRAPHTMSTTSLRRRLLTQPPLPPDTEVPAPSSPPAEALAAGAPRVLEPSAVRLNATEFATLSGRDPTVEGVAAYALEIVSTIALTGPSDLVTDGLRHLLIENGHPLMAKVTAMGCAGSAVAAAFLAVERDPVAAVASSLAVMGLAGERAGRSASGPGSFAVAVLDALAALAPGDLAAARIR